MVDQARGQVLMDSMAIAEYFEETVEGKAMINGTAANRAEIRRLTAWFDHAFYYEVTGPLLFERMQKPIVHRQPPDGRPLRDARKAANNHHNYVVYMTDPRTLLAGAT